MSKVWLVGDNFLAENYRKNFKKATYELYLKNRFEVTPYCSSRFSDRNTNAISRLVNSFVQAMNTKFYLPEYVIIMLDNDLIEYVQYKRFGVAALLGSWIEYLAQFFVETLETRDSNYP